MDLECEASAARQAILRAAVGKALLRKSVRAAAETIMVVVVVVEVSCSQKQIYDTRVKKRRRRANRMLFVKGGCHTQKDLSVMRSCRRFGFSDVVDTIL